ncbi:hypothetical protein A1O1_00083 [Capronia coronata CBS 617.96]|uniref:F-box domain-containing protein n=1 Tax=Capronia coronata CBS 617.96 TaxID=1182541 RepID=W9YZ63_9EURO|nr:uncharacterized protein A1O1_00083 [Capronia coronata CBS 617.96]EXJ94965.1 hypothetical protein A1O1_00083 [Capronia coronata CBS 617.96]
MLQELPVEVIQQIAGYLPTASSIVNLSLTNHKLYDLVSADHYAIFREFVQRQFPSIRTPPFWRDAARVLTSRSRAWDRRAFIARECCPPPDNVDFPQGYNPGYTVGYRPVIDSYQVWQGGSWSSRKEVLAWGAAGRLRTRTIKDGVATWSSLRIPEDYRQDLDILDVRLLLPHQHENSDGETIILRRANHEIVKVETSSKSDHFTENSRYVMRSEELSCMDITRSAQPILAALDNSSIHLYPVHSSERNVRPMDSVPIQEKYTVRKRMRCAKFLSEDTLAVGVQFLEGRDRAPIDLYDISPTGLSVRRLSQTLSFSESIHAISGRHSANVIMPLDDFGTSTRRPGQIFLSGWSDGIARLHDTRTPTRPVAEYIDFVDDGQILSLLSIGHERFLAGSSQNGCLKTFDLRMPGGRVYSYLEARSTSSSSSSRRVATPDVQLSTESQPSNARRDFNIFLTPPINHGERLWQPLSRRPGRRFNRYRGSVYSLSSPSPMSPTIYAGIENHVMQLDFVSTDDFRNDVPGLVDPILGLDDKTTHIFNFSCYERPREGRESTDPVLLRKQLSLTNNDRRDSQTGQGENHGSHGVVEDGWDERWRLETYDRTRGRNRDWGQARG